jgi:hypothetical protein
MGRPDSQIKPCMLPNPDIIQKLLNLHIIITELDC